MTLDESHDDGQAISDINMTPLVDVMLVLLIIFIITVPVLTQTVHVELPRTDGKPAPIAAEHITLTVAVDGQVFWDKEIVDADTLASKLATLASQEPERSIHLHGDRQVPYERVMDVMAAVQAAGISRLGFVTEPAS